MELKIKDICEMLQISEKTVYRWIESNKIPAYKINYQYRFKKQEIDEWILKNKVLFSKKEICCNSHPLSILNLIKKGGVYYQIEGSNVKDVLTKAILQANLDHSLNKENIIASLIQREEMASTSIGKGIAVPHPRNPIINHIDNESLSVFFLKNPIDYHSIDGIPVHTLFVLLSSVPKRHVEVLSKLSFLCQEESFQCLLKTQPVCNELFSYISCKEEQWIKKSDPIQ